MDLNSTLANLIKHKINESEVCVCVSLQGNSCSKVLEVCDGDMSEEHGLRI